MHHEFLNDEKIPEIKEKKPITLIDSEGNRFSGYRIFNIKGVSFEPSREKLITPNTENEYFIRTLNEIDSLKIKLEKRGYIIEKIEPIKWYQPEDKTLIKNLNANVTFTRFICKVALEYICHRFGNKIVMNQKYDLIRNFVRGKTETLPDSFSMSIEDMDVDPLVTFYRFSKHDRHTLRIFYHDYFKKWIFYLSVFNVTTFKLMFPENYSLSDCFDEIIIRKYK